MISLLGARNLKIHIIILKLKLLRSNKLELTDCIPELCLWVNIILLNM